MAICRRKELIMKKDKFGTLQIALKNIRNKPFRSFGLIFLTMIMSYILLVGSFVLYSFSNGTKSLSNRLGADIIIVPEGYNAKIESVLLNGEPSSFYLPKGAYEKLKKYSEIEKMTPQLYIATLKASCCSYPIQIMGIDWESDFLVKTWLEKTSRKKLENGEIIIGKNIVGESGEKLKFFDEELQIMSRLERTGMGFDTTGFVNMETAVKLAKASERIKKNKAAHEKDLISCILVKVKPGYDSVELADKINADLAKDGIFAMFSKKFVNDISSNLSFISLYISSFQYMFFIMSVLILTISYSSILNERKKEFAIFRILGMTKKNLFTLILKEAFLISLIGTTVGFFVGGISLVALIPKIVSSLKIPFLIPSFKEYALIFLLNSGLCIFSGPLACLFSSVKNFKKDIYVSLRENE